MEKYLVQAIVLIDKRILLSRCEGEDIKGALDFLSRSSGDVDSSLNEMVDEIKERFKVEIKNHFKLRKEMFPDTITFLVEMESGKGGEVYSENLKYSDSESKEYELLPFSELADKGKLTKQLILLYGECVDRDYEPLWLDELEDMVGSSNYNAYGTYQMINKRRVKAKEKIDKHTPNTQKITAVLIALLLGVAFDYLFIDKAIGISHPVFVILLAGFFLWNLRGRLKPGLSAGCLLIIPIILLSITFAVFTNELLTALNIILIPLLMVSSCILITNPEVKWDNLNFLSKIVERAVSLTFENCLKPFRFMLSGLKESNPKTMSTTKKGILNGLIISIPLLFVILILLASADMVFGFYIANFMEVFEDFDFGRTASHLVVIVVVFLYVFAFVWSFRYPYRTSGRSLGSSIRWEPVTLLTVLFVINIVYLIFTIIQFSYLYGGGVESLPAGFTYAEYARKGFFELVAVTVINFTILLAAIKFTSRENKVMSNLLNTFLTITVLFTFNMLFSAHYKMSLYEETYGLTYLRVFVHYFMLMLSVLFVIALISIWSRRFPMTKAMLATALAMYVVLNYLNVDVIIAKANLERYRETKKIDVLYLTRLSDDVVPYIKEFKDDSDASVRSRVCQYLDSKKNILESQNSWSEFNYSRYKARRSLSELKK